MLPFSYSIKEPIAAFAFLLGMLAVTGTTGDLTSILFGIPGEGSSAALILDGYPMSKNGEAGRALGAAIMSSVLGSVIGALSLALSIPIVRPLVLALRLAGTVHHRDHGHHLHRHTWPARRSSRDCSPAVSA